MKQVLKYILQALLGISLLLLISGAIITFFFSKKVEKKVISNIQQQITSELQLGDVTFSIYEKFPSASVKIADLLAFEKEGFDDDTLFYAKKTYIELNIFDIISNIIDIKKVVIDRGIINIKYDDEDKPNFTIFKTFEENKNQIVLNQILMLNTTVKCIKNNLDINWLISKSLLIFKENNVDINAKLFSEQLEVRKRDYLHKKKIELKTNICFKKDSIFIQKGTSINIEDIVIELSGEIFHANILDLNFACNAQELAAVIKHTPQYLKAIYQSFQANGKLSCKGNIKGVMSTKRNPELNMSCHIEDGNFKLNSNPFILKKINLDAEITNGKSRNFITTKIKISQFDAKTKNGSIKGDFTIKNLDRYHLMANLSSSWNLAEINNYFEDSPFLNLNGELRAKTQYTGYISFDKKFKDYFINARHRSNVTFKDASFKYKDFPLAFNLQIANCKFKNNIIEVEKSAFTISDSDLQFNGNITDLIAYILNRKEKINIIGDIKSTYIKFDELITLKDLSKSNNINTSAMPNWIKANLNSSISTFAYNDFITNEISGILNYEGRTLTGKKIKLSTLNGSVYGNFKFYESTNNRLKLSSQLNLKKLNIRNAFLAFDNFKQDFITAEHIKGIGTAEIEMQATWKPGFIFEDKKLKVKSHLIIEKGKLIQFKPLESLSEYINLEGLKEVTFSTLENTIEIDNKVITIPAMEIKSSALSVFISGTHTFEQEINYRIKLLLSELMSTKFRKKNTKIKKSEFGEVEENGRIFNTIYLKMTGNSNDPNISFDGIRFREDVQKEITKEKETIIKIIKEDILKTKEQEKIGQEEDLIIEWDDE